MRPRWIFALIVALALANLMVFAAARFAVTPLRVSSNSMEPILHPGDRILIDRTRSFGALRHGDLIVFHARADRPGKARFNATEGTAPGNSLIVKRVIALPGESLQAHDRTIAINDSYRLNEPYARWGETPLTIAATTVASDAVYVMGDNREFSYDSRQYGPVPKSAFLGVARFRVWPLSRIGPL